LLCQYLKSQKFSSHKPAQNAKNNQIATTLLAESIETNIQKYIYLQVNDDSMAPQITRGDIIQVHKQSTIDNGNIGVVRLHKSGLAVRRITVINEKILLSADNPTYGQLILDSADCEIMGQVSKAIKKVR
jgi:SOS-response transcriptional repressor LexA